MEEIDINVLIDMAKELKNKSMSWHHHLLTPNCCFNSSGKYRIILENEDTKKIYYCDFEDKPMNQLKKLEDLFFDC